MTREEARELLLHILMTYEPKDQYGDYDDPQPYEEALDMAIEALAVRDCHGCRHYDLLQTPVICHNCARAYKDKYTDM